MEIMYMPEVRKEFKYSDLLQLFVYLHEDFKEDIIPKLKDELTKINMYLPLGQFGYNDADNYLYYKYNYMIPIETNAGVLNSIKDVVWLMAYNVNVFLPKFHEILGIK